VNPQTINEKIQTLLGGRLTKKWVLDTYLSPIYEAKTFGQLRQRTQEALHELENLGAFDKVSITIDEPTTKTGGNANSAIDVVINVDILEKKKLSGQSGVESTPGMSELGLVRLSVSVSFLAVE
jgi:outer membrane protein assembly factor BamA